MLTEFEVEMLKKSVVRKNSLLQTVRCTNLGNENCATSFPSICCRLHIFTDELVWS